MRLIDHVLFDRARACNALRDPRNDRPVDDAQPPMDWHMGTTVKDATMISADFVVHGNINVTNKAPLP